MFGGGPGVTRQAQGHEGFPAQDSIGTAEERRIPPVLALLDRSVEQLRLAAQGITVRNIPKVLRRLDERHLSGIKVAKDTVQEPGFRDLVRVQNGHEFTGGHGEGIIDVACLGEPLPAIPFGAPPDVSDADLPGCRGEVTAVAIVQDPRFVRIFHVPGRDGRPEDEVERLVIGGDENVHGPARQGRRGGGRRRAFHMVAAYNADSPRLYVSAATRGREIHHASHATVPDQRQLM